MTTPETSSTPESLALAGCHADDIADLNRALNPSPWSTHGTISAAHAESCDALADALAVLALYRAGGQTGRDLAHAAAVTFDPIVADLPLLMNLARTATYHALAGEGVHTLVDQRRQRAVRALHDHGDTLGFRALAVDMARQTTVAFNKSQVLYLDALQARRRAFIGAETLALALAYIDAGDNLTRTLIGANALAYARRLVQDAFTASWNVRYLADRADDAAAYYADVESLAGPRLGLNR